MKQLSIVTALLLAFGASSAYGDRDQSIRINLKGFQEVPAVSTAATGRLRASIDNDEIRYTLSWQGLQGNVTQAHIHLGQRHTNGGIVLWLCQTATNPAPPPLVTVPPAEATPMCPVPQMPGGEVEVSGTLSAGNVTAIGGANVGQQISAGEWAEVLKAIRAGATYANVHSSLSPGGEIRGQVSVRGGHGHHDDDDDD
jgi:hypothetical protein